MRKNKVHKIKLVKKGLRLGEIFYTGGIQAKVLLDNCAYPTYKPNQTIVDGYQREQKAANVSAVAERTAANLASFDAFIDNVNINIRDAGVHNKDVKPLNPKLTDDGEFYIFEYDPSTLKNPELWTVDGQTRVKGLAKARAEAQISKDFNTINEIDSKMIGINLTFTTNIYKECFCFYLLNHYSSNIAPEGALRMMFDGWSQGKIDFVNEITNNPRARTKLNDVRAMGITENLSSNSNVWAGFISDFNENDKVHKVSIKAMTNILKPLLEKIDKDIAAKQLATKAEVMAFDIFEAFWEGLALWEPKMFDPATKYDYGIMKSSQAEVLTKVLLQIFSEHESWGKLGTSIGSLTDPKTYKQLVEVAFDKQHLIQKNGMNKNVSGPDCWKVGKLGSMGSATSSAAKRDMKDVLFALIKDQLKRKNPSII